MNRPPSIKGVERQSLSTDMCDVRPQPRLGPPVALLSAEFVREPA